MKNYKYFQNMDKHNFQYNYLNISSLIHTMDMMRHINMDTHHSFYKAADLYINKHQHLDNILYLH